MQGRPYSKPPPLEGFESILATKEVFKNYLWAKTIQALLSMPLLIFTDFFFGGGFSYFPPTRNTLRVGDSVVQARRPCAGS